MPTPGPLRGQPARPALPALLAIVLLAAACAGGDPAAPPTGPEPGAPTPPPVVEVRPDPTVTTWLPGQEPFVGIDLEGVALAAWPDLLVDRRTTTGPGPLDVTAEVARRPDACTLWTRTVVDVDLGPGPVAAAMAAAVRDVLASGDHAPVLLEPGEDPWCTDRTDDGLAFLATEVWEEPCAIPGGPDLRCVTVATVRYDGGAHPNRWHDVLVLDATTGGRLRLDDVTAVAGIDAAELATAVDVLVCDLDRASGLIGRDQDCWDTVPRAFRPSTGGLTLSFATYEAAPYVVGPRDLFLPWDVVAAGPTVPAPVVAAQRTLLRAVRDGDWAAVAALIPADGAFRAGFGNPGDPIAFYRSLPRDPREEWVTILTQPAGRVLQTTVWPELHAREAFVIADAERAELEAAYGAESIRGWESAGMYLGWRAGFDPDGTWRFMVAGD